MMQIVKTYIAISVEMRRWVSIKYFRVLYLSCLYYLYVMFIMLSFKTRYILNDTPAFELFQNTLISTFRPAWSCDMASSAVQNLRSSSTLRPTKEQVKSSSDWYWLIKSISSQIPAWIRKKRKYLNYNKQCLKTTNALKSDVNTWIRHEDKYDEQIFPFDKLDTRICLHSNQIGVQQDKVTETFDDAYREIVPADYTKIRLSIDLNCKWTSLISMGNNMIFT